MKLSPSCLVHPSIKSNIFFIVHTRRDRFLGLTRRTHEDGVLGRKEPINHFSSIGRVRVRLKYQHQTLFTKKIKNLNLSKLPELQRSPDAYFTLKKSDRYWSDLQPFPVLGQALS